MKSPKVYEVLDVVGFLKIIERYQNPPWVYRGQADESWPLIPKAGRCDFHDTLWEQEREQELSSGKKKVRPAKDLGRFRFWRHKAIAYAGPLPENDFECLGYAQHYGLATRLLDWTENPLVALFFAAESLDPVNGAVFAYLNCTIIRAENAKLSEYNRVAMYYPRPIDRRLLVQSAIFSYHPEPQMPLEPSSPDNYAKTFAPDGVDLVKIVIPSKWKKVISRGLNLLGISRKTLFPDLEGLSAFVNWQTRDDIARSQASGKG